MANTPLVSVIVRTWNEGKYLEKVLTILEHQTYQNFEIIIVDDHSKDETLAIAAKHNCKIVNIPDGQFSHPHSCNLGAENANGEYLVYLNGHSIPTSVRYLANGLKNFNDQNVAGAFSYPIAHKNMSLADKVITLPGYTVGMVKFDVNHFMPGCLNTMNAIIRKDLWDEYNFAEGFNGGWGGEDLDWAMHFIKKGYIIVNDPHFKTRHSHNLKMKDVPFHVINGAKMARTKKKSSKADPVKQRRNF